MIPSEIEIVSIEEGTRESDPEVSKYKAAPHKDHDKAVDPDSKQLIDNEKVVPDKEAKEAKEDKADAAPDATVQISKETMAELDAKDGHTTDLSTIQFGNNSEVISKERDLTIVSILSDNQPVYNPMTTFIVTLPPSVVTSHNNGSSEGSSAELNPIQGTSGSDVIFGTFEADLLLGLHGNDILYGLSGNDVSDGGPGADLMIGGSGNDNYFVDNQSDLVVELVNQGVDTVFTNVSYYLNPNLAAMTAIVNATLVSIALPPIANVAVEVENLTGLGSADLILIGNHLDNIIRGNTGNNTINGLLGADTMIGSLGDDQYHVDNPGDVVEENASEGIDSIFTTISFTLPDNVESIIAMTSGIVVAGNDSDNFLNSGGHNNITLVGGFGNDIYILNLGDELVIESSGAGVDMIQTSVSFTLPSNVENIRGLGSDSINLTGNSDSNLVFGNAGNNLLTGGLGADNFRFIVNSTGDDKVTDFTLAQSDMLSFFGVTDTDGIPGLDIQDLKLMVTSVENPGGVDTKFNFAAGQSVTLAGIVVSNVDDVTIAPQIQVFG